MNEVERLAARSGGGTFLHDARQASIVKPTRNYLLIFLALTTLGGAVLAWKQHLELIALRGQLEAKDWDAQQHLHALEAQVASLRAANAKALAAASHANNDQPQRGRFGRFANWEARMNDPQFAARVAAQQRAQIGLAYGPLFKQLAQQLGLTPEQLAAFQNLLAEKQSAARDVLAAARDQGLDPRDANDRAEIAQLVGQADAASEGQIESAIGAAAYAQYQGYEQTIPERNTANELQTNLNNLGISMTSSEYNQILGALAAAPSQNSLRPLLEGPNSTAPITAKNIPTLTAVFPTPEQSEVAPVLSNMAAAGAAAGGSPFRGGAPTPTAGGSTASTP